MLIAAIAAITLGLPQDKFPTITPQSCLDHVKFLASDELQGRGTPSAGLDKAADYIATQFEKAGLLALNKDGYFQETEFENRRTQMKGKVRNVIGIVPGTDKALMDTYVLVTAHYDHLGRVTGDADTIYNGANDNASGTSGIIEIGKALARSKPSRTIVFVAFWGEEMGLRGARHYAETPPFPLAKTVAMINLEQIGRTDDDEGPRVSEFNVTGFDFSNLSDKLKKAAEPMGVKVSMHAKNSTPYFFASDNAALAQKGIPAHTISTAYSFPDYHKVGDHWEKIDANNMAKIVKAICAGVLAIANDAEAPKWNENQPAAKRFLDAWKTLTGAPQASHRIR
jgi:Zn-dependent M28 family amino/carboxypeptidase